MTDFTPEAVLAELKPHERRAVASILDTLGLEPEDWPAVPPLEKLLPLTAALRRVAPGHSVDGIRAAYEELGGHDDPDRDSSYHPGDKLSRRLHEWHSRVADERGENLKSPPEDAA